MIRQARAPQIMLVALLAILVGIAAAGGDENAAATQPTTEPAVHKAQLPPGFHLLTLGDRQFFCLPADDAWVKEASDSVAPATRPTTTPSDIINTITQHRQELTHQVVQDLALSDHKAVDELLDTKLLPALARTAAFKPTIYYFPAHRAKVAAAMEAGWTDPRFHYIRFAHDVSYDPGAMLLTERPMDDLVWWVEIHDGDTLQTRKDALAAEIQNFEMELTSHRSTFSKNLVEHQFAEFIHNQVFEPLKLPGQLEWFDFGVSSIFSIKYSAMATGISRQQWAQQLIGLPGDILPFMRVDLLNTLDPAQIRPEYLATYDQAVMPKGALVIHSWLAKSGEGALAKVLPLIRAHTPATPAELLKDVKDATGVDLTPDLKPDYRLPLTQP